MAISEIVSQLPVLSVVVAFYAFGAIVFFSNTFLEGEADGSGWNASRIAGLLCCAAWPAVMLAVGVAALRTVKPSRRRYA